MKTTVKLTINNKRKGEVLTREEFNFLRFLNSHQLNNSEKEHRGVLIKLQGKLERIWGSVLEDEELNDFADSMNDLFKRKQNK